MTAVVKWYSYSKGYGFVITESGKEGDKITVDLYDGPKGFQAMNGKLL